VAVVDQPDSNLSKSEDLDSSAVPKETLYQKMFASVLTCFGNNLRYFPEPFNNLIN
jgi:hypothetical protein